jgi:hypothetical protein
MFNANPTVFFQGPTSLLGRLVSLVTGSPYSHVFIGLGNGYYAEAAPDGVRMFDLQEFKRRKVTAAFELLVSPGRAGPSRVDIIEKMMVYAGRGYDFGRSLSYIVGHSRFLSSRYKYNCVELVAVLSEELYGAPRLVEPGFSPAEVYEVLSSSELWRSIG